MKAPRSASHSRRTLSANALDFARRAMLEYGSHTIEQRAIPDFRDGLKPVHRMIVWAAYQAGMRNSGNFSKSAFLVGRIIGEYHPHGDSGTYLTMCKMTGVLSEDRKRWSQLNSLVPFIEGYGNFGDFQDGAAAMRYCFTGDTRVMTEHGLIRMDALPTLLGNPEARREEGAKLNFNSKVASLDEALPASHWINSGRRKVYEIRTKRGFTVRATGNEPFYVLNGLDYEWRELSALRVGDMLSMKRGSDILPGPESRLPEFPYRQRRASDRHFVDSFPTNMSEELAFILGVLVSEGYGRFGVGFNTTSKSYHRKFVRCWKKVFPNVTYSVHVRDPHSYGNKRSIYFVAPGLQIKAYFESLGVRFGSYRQVVPEVMFRASLSEMSSFLSALFEGDGSVAGTFIDYHSKSDKLKRDLQLVLLNYYGCVATIGRAEKLYITGSENMLTLLGHLRFCAPAKQEKLDALLQRVVEANVGNTGSDVFPDSLHDALRSMHADAKVSARVYVDEFGVSRTAMSGELDMLHRAPKTRRRFYDHAEKNLESFAGAFPKAAAKLKTILDRDYFYDEIVSITPVGKKWTYDLTVPNTHAFVANGFIAHNTECKLSKFAELLLLDNTYLAVTPMFRNFNNTQDVPLVLPARLPMLLALGTYGIAVGVTCSSPSYKLRNVAALTELYLTKDAKKITSSEVVKALGRPAYNYGGTCVSPVSALKEFVETGKTKLHYQPTFNVVKNVITMTSICVRLDLTSVMEKIAALKGVRGVAEYTGSGAFKVVIKCMSNVDMEQMLAQVKKVCTASLTYSLAITNRIAEEEVKFRTVNVMEMMEDWIKWRIGLEINAIDYLVAKHEKRTAYLRLLQKAVDHLQVIIDSLRRDDSAAYIAQKLKITVDEANIILDLRVRQLKSLEIKKLKQEEAELAKMLTTLRRDRKNPRNRILADLHSTMAALKTLPDTAAFM